MPPDSPGDRFPYTWMASQGALGGAEDGFVAKLDSTSALIYCTYLGGGSTDIARVASA